MLGVSLPITISPQNSTKGASLRCGATNISYFDLRSKASSRTLTSPLEVSPILTSCTELKGGGEASNVESSKLVATGMLEKDEVTSGKEVKGGLNTSSRSVKDVSSTTSGRRKDS